MPYDHHPNIADQNHPMSKPIAPMSELDANLWIEKMKACGRSGHYFELGPDVAASLALYIEDLRDRLEGEANNGIVIATMCSGS